MKKLIAISFLLTPFFSFCQNRFTLSGYIKDSLTDETLIGATVYMTNKTKGITSNQFGFYSITLPAGTYNFICSFIGYNTKIKAINLDENVLFNFEMLPKITTEQAVVVSSKKRDANVKNAQMGKLDLSIDQIKSIPAFLGEVDVLKAVQLLPGVQSSEGNTGLYVRGGGADQNLILLDDAVVYNTGHLFGFFSIFNGDAIKNTSLIKGGMPAQYGGRLSSVLDISMKEGNDKNFAVQGGIGLIASRVSIEGPVKKNKASFIVSARRTYIDALVKPFVKKSSSFYGSGYYFYDLNAKINYKFSEKDRLYLSGYFGKDKFDFVNGKQSLSVHIPWGNATGTIRYNRVFNSHLFSNTTFAYNNYNFNFGANQNNFDIKLFSGIRDLNMKEDFDLYTFSNHKLKFGALYTYHTFTPNVFSGKQDSVEFKPDNPPVKYANEAAVYLQDDWDVSNKIKINAGIRESVFEQVGRYTNYVLDANGNRIDSTVYNKGEAVKTYFGFEPRFTIRYAINDETSIKAAITKNFQYIHLVSNSASTLPTDLWVPSTLKVKPQESWLYALGLFKNYNDNMYETSVEVYYKQLKNQIEYEQGYTPATLEDTEDFFTFGKGWSYGSEFFINKTKGKLTGWIGYTLSWTFRKFDGLNNGDKFYAKYDRRHDIDVVGIYELSKKWKLSGTFIYGTGNAATLPERFYIFDGVLTQQYSSIDAYRLPSYHRLDIAATYSPNKHLSRKLKSEWVFSIYNVYSHLNPYFIYFDQSGSPYNGTLQVQAKKVALFPAIPSVTWNFKL